MSDDETLILRTTVIAGIRYADDYAVVWRGLSIGRIMRAIGAASDKQPWAWNCYVHGRPSSADDSGTGHDLEDAPRPSFGRHGRASAQGSRSSTSRARGTTPRPAAKHSPDITGRDEHDAELWESCAASRWFHQHRPRANFPKYTFIHTVRNDFPPPA